VSARKKSRDLAPSGAPPAQASLERILKTSSPWPFFALFAVLVFLFYAVPLFSTDASIQLDAADYHYSAQKYFADHIRSGKLPHWTPYPFSGMPFLADIQVGAWYPLNWPFFLAGITPKAIEWELALHCLLACTGAFLVARELLRDTVAALLAGILYGFGGFFAAHSSHIGMFQAAALLPWLVWTGMEAVRRLRWLPAAAMIAAGTVLAGYFQAALYTITAFALFLTAAAIPHRRLWPRTLLVLASTAVMTLALTAIQVLPGLELARESIRSSLDFRRGANATLVPGALLTLISPNHYNAPANDYNYKGPEDITQFYYYQGLLLLPLAALGLAKGPRRAIALALAIALPALWYGFGPRAGFYLLVAQFPGFKNIRAPAHIWFVVAFALTLLAAAGVPWLLQRFPRRWLAAGLLAACTVDLWYWNMAVNHLSYARVSFDDHYDNFRAHFRTIASQAVTGPLYRLYAPFDSPGFGQLNAMLDSHIEVTYGYNPLQLARYEKYTAAAKNNPKLLDALAVTAKLNMSNGFFDANPAALPRISAPAAVTRVPSGEAAAALLGSLDPALNSIVEEPAVAQAGAMTAQIRSYTGDEYRIAYRAERPTLVRIAVPYFPGWRAEVGGRSLPVFPIDVALSGVMLPAGEQELVFRYQSTWFGIGAVISLVGWIAMAGALAWAFAARRRDQARGN
jgi:hypothetical protein